MAGLEALPRFREIIGKLERRSALLSATLTSNVVSTNYEWIRTGYEQNGTSRYRLSGSTSTEPHYLEIRHSIRQRNSLVFDVHNVRVSTVAVDANGKQYPTTSNFTIEIPRTSEVTALTEVYKAISAIMPFFEVSADNITALTNDGVAWLLGDY